MAPNDSLAVRIDRCYQYAASLINAHPPIGYLLGGGHPGFGPSGDPPVIDCSGFASAVLHAGGLLAKPAAKIALDTAEFMHWGVPGQGELTVWVRHDSVQDHCFLEFSGFQHRYCESSHPGQGPRWLTLETFLDFVPRTLPRNW